MDQSEAIQDRFGAAAAAYATSSVHRGGPDLDAMLDAGVASGSERVLDLGCGPGHTSLAFAGRVRRVTGLDLTEAMLEQARWLAAERGIRNATFERGDAADLPFPAGRFEIVTSRLSAHHYADPAAVIREVARVLAPGGVFLLVDSVAPEDPSRDTFLNAFELLRDPSHVRDHKVSEWLQMFRVAGLVPEHLGDFSIHQGFDPWVERIGTHPGAVVGLKALFDAAPDEARAHYEIQADYAFRLDLALLRGRLAR